MTIVLLAIWLPLKHLIIANVLDVGYSRSRDLRYIRWMSAMWTWIGTELMVTYLLVRDIQDHNHSLLLTLEAILLTVATLHERRAFLGSELRTHFMWEIVIMIAYAVYGFVHS